MVWTLGIPFQEQIRFKAAFGEAVLGVMDRLVLSDAAWERIAPLVAVVVIMSQLSSREVLFHKLARFLPRSSHRF